MTTPPNSQMRSIGRTRFILYFGVLGFGLLAATLFVAWSLYTKEDLSMAQLIIPFIAFPLSGVAWGAVMWSFFSKASKQEHRDESKEDHNKE